MFRALCGFVLVGAAAAAADSALLQYAPPNTGVILGINLKQLRTSEFGGALFSQMRKQSHPGQAFDPFRDADEVVIALPEKNPNGKGLVLMRGRCDAQALASVKGMASAQASDAALECLGPTLLAAGDPASVRAVRQGTGGGADATLLAKAREMAAANDIWLVSRAALGDLAAELPVNATPQAGFMTDLLNSVRQLSAGVKFGPRLLLTADLGASSENDAAGLASALRALSAMGANQGAGGLAPLLAKVEVRPEGKSVKLSLAVAQEELARAFQASMEGMFKPRAPQDTGVTIYSSPTDMGVVKIK